MADEESGYTCRKHGRLEGPYCEGCEDSDPAIERPQCLNCHEEFNPIAPWDEFCSATCEKEYQDIVE